jgi:hypothetical protein
MTKTQTAAIPLKSYVRFREGTNIHRGYVIANGHYSPDVCDPGAFLKVMVKGYGGVFRVQPADVLSASMA